MKVPFSEEEVISYIKDNWLTPHDAVLADINSKNVLRKLATRYAYGEKWLASRTAQARKEYQNLFDTNLLPKDQTRRVIDVISSRIKDVLPVLATRIAVEETIISHPDLDDKEIAQVMYDLIVEKEKYFCQVPNAIFVKNIRSQMNNNGGTLPDYVLDTTTKFVLSVSDQLADVKRISDNRIELSIHMKRKKAKLIFKLPDKTRYQTGKVALPDIMRTAKNKSGILFDFSIAHNAPQPYEPQCSLGADVGVIYPVVSALVGDGWHSQSFYPNGQVLDLIDKINDLSFQKAVLELKIEQNSKPNRSPGPKQVKTFEELVREDELECERLAGKISDLKREVSRWVAHFLCETAISHSAQIVIEELNWSIPSHSFYHGSLHNAVKNLALVSGIPVIEVRARGTSSQCCHDGSTLVQGVKSRPPAVKNGSKRRNGWRKVDRSSGLRDKTTRVSISKSKNISPFDVSFDDVANVKNNNDGYINRGARCVDEGIVRDHDAVSALNLGVSGEVKRGVLTSHYCLKSSVFKRVRRRAHDFQFGWAVMLSATAAVSASAPVTGSAGVPNDAVGLLMSGSPPS